MSTTVAIRMCGDQGHVTNSRQLIMTKAELRNIYLKRRAELSLAEVAAASKRIAECFFDEVDLAEVKSVHTFIRIAKFNEIDTSNIYYRIWHERRDINTYAPKSDLVTGEMESIRFDEDTVWTENRWGIREPAIGETIEPEEIDLVVIPLLCFDLLGNRVGYGKGFYDKFLAKCRQDCVKVGLSLFPPVEKIDDADTNDVELNVVITPHEVFRWPSSYIF